METPASRASAILICAPASGQGKTTVTAALARQAMRAGKRVRVFKTGPDFIDPMILARAAGQPVYQLDLWMGGLAHCRNLLYQAARNCDLILVEGVMGLYDGTPSSAELARQFNLPLLIVIDASAMAQTFGALAVGLKSYGADLAVHGIVANRVAGSGHAALLAESLAGPAAGISFSAPCAPIPPSSSPIVTSGWSRRRRSPTSTRGSIALRRPSPRPCGSRTFRR